MNAIVDVIARPVPLYAAALGAVAGAAGAYFFLDWKMGKAYDRRLLEELDGIRIYYGEEKPSTPEELVAEKYPEVDNQLELIQTLKYDAETNDPDMVEVVTNVFTNADDIGDFDADEEMANREAGRPYVMLFEQFHESEYDGITLTWFEGDGVLVDSDNRPIVDVDEIVGEDSLMKFGNGSRDNNIVYVCNEELDSAFEIVRNTGRYDEVVLGLRHSEPSMLRRMRPSDY